MPVAKPRLLPLTWKHLVREGHQRMQDIFAHLPTLTTERLILRPLQLKDAADMFAYASDPQVAEHVLWRAHGSIRDTQAFIRFVLAQYRRGEPSTFGVWHKGDRRLIGTMGYTAWSETDRMAEVGYSFSRAYWGQGLAAEALEALLQFSFDVLYLHRVEGQHTPQNPASGRVMEKVGMRREGHMRGRVWNKGVFVDTVMYGILRSDWEQLQRTGTLPDV